VFCRERDGVFCYNGFACRSMRRNEYRIPVLQMIHCLLLEIIQFEGILQKLAMSIAGVGLGGSYLVSHLGNEFMKIGHFLVYIDDVSPFFASISPPRR